MSQGETCRCKGKKDRRKYHRVLDDHCNHSAFNGYYTYSDYSAVVCLSCGAHWRSKAAYVNSLMRISTTERENWMNHKMVKI